MSTLYTDNIRANNASQITIPTGQKIVGTDAGSIVAPGQVIQVVSAEKLDSTAYNSTLGTWTDVGLSCTITPKFNNSKILVQVNAALGNTVAVFNYMRVVRNIGGGSYSMISEANTPGNRNAIHGMIYENNNEGILMTQSVTILDSPATTSAVIYKIQGACSGTAYSYIGQSNRDRDGSDYDPRSASRIVLQEIAQ